MLRQTRTKIIQTLWEDYLAKSSQMQLLQTDLQQRSASSIILDHFAIIDLPGSHTGIPILRELFEMLGYVKGGAGYLAEKQNDFLWLAEADSQHEPAIQALPQVVVADFRLEELSNEVSAIIKKYASFAPPPPFTKIRELIAKNDASASLALIELVTTYCTTRDWPLPTVDEYMTVAAQNPLLAWVLANGRRPNHFTISLHHLSHFKDIAHFHHYIEQELKLPLNDEGGKIKGTEQCGLMQGSTIGTPQTIELADGQIQLANDFVEFVWRFSKEFGKKPTKWCDYFTGFFAQNADKVIESLTTR